MVDTGRTNWRGGTCLLRMPGLLFVMAGLFLFAVAASAGRFSAVCWLTVHPDDRCRGFIGSNDRSCQQCVRHSFQFWLIKKRLQRFAVRASLWIREAICSGSSDG